VNVENKMRKLRGKAPKRELMRALPGSRLVIDGIEVGMDLSKIKPVSFSRPGDSIVAAVQDALAAQGITDCKVSFAESHDPEAPHVVVVRLPMPAYQDVQMLAVEEAIARAAPLSTWVVAHLMERT
jgi:hypothetical protein